MIKNKRIILARNNSQGYKTNKIREQNIYFIDTELNYKYLYQEIIITRPMTLATLFIRKKSFYFLLEDLRNSRAKVVKMRIKKI